MNEEFKKELNEFLDFECDDYGIFFEIVFNEDFEGECEAKVYFKTAHGECEVEFYFENKKLMLCIYEDVTEEVSICTDRVFWITVAPNLFPKHCS